MTKDIATERAKLEARLANILEELAFCYGDLANLAMLDHDRHTCFRMVERERDAHRRQHHATKGHGYRY